MAERRSLTNGVQTPVPGVAPEIVRTFVTQNLPTDQSHPELASQADSQSDWNNAIKPVVESRLRRNARLARLTRARLGACR